MPSMNAEISATNGMMNAVLRLFGPVANAQAAETLVSGAKTVLTNNGYTITNTAGTYSPDPTALS